MINDDDDGEGEGEDVMESKEKRTGGKKVGGGEIIKPPTFSTRLSTIPPPTILHPSSSTLSVQTMVDQTLYPFPLPSGLSGFPT